MITERCNCKCFFCSRNNLSKHHNEPSLEECCRAFDILSSAYPSSKLILSGGEPTLSKNIIPILNHVSPIFKKVEIQTNGTFSDQIAEKLKPYLNNNLFLQFSLDGTKDIHDWIRGEGTFDKVIKNLRCLQEYHSHLSISVTVTPLNMHSVLLLTNYLNAFKFRRLTISYVQPLDPCKEQIISNKTWNEFVNKLLLHCYYRVDISKLYDFSLMDKVLASNQKWNGIVNCGRGITHFYVSSNFDVLPCTCTNVRVGNVLEDDISFIKEKLALNERVSMNESAVCYSCKYLPICNGGCPGLSLKVFGTDNMGDIRCPKVYEFARANGFLLIDNFI